MSKLKILFQEPIVPRKVTYGRFHKEAGSNTFPYGVACIAAYIRERGYEVDYIDPNIEDMNYEKYTDYIRHNKYDVIGIGSTTLQIDYAAECFSIIKKTSPNTITVLGGIHGTLMPNETVEEIDDIDYIILGEGEKPFYHLLENAYRKRKDLCGNIDGICFKNNGRIVLNMPNASNRLLPEEIPIPLYNIFPMNKYIPQITFAKKFPSYTVIASRGCPFKCTFCNAADILGRKARYKPITTLINEIKILKEQHGAKGIMFLDSTFTLNKHWVKEFCFEYMRSDLGLPWACNTRADTIDKALLMVMKKAGCWGITIGAESGSQKSLDLINKGTTVEQNTYAIKTCVELGFYVYTSYIICLPYETEDDALKTIRYARKQGNHLAIFYLPIPFPKTKLWETCKATGGIRENALWSEYNSWDFSRPVYINPLIGKVKMQQLLGFAFRQFYSNPIVIYRNLKELLLLRQSYYKFWLGTKGIIKYVLQKL